MLRRLFHQYRRWREIRELAPDLAPWGGDRFGPDDPWAIDLPSSIHREAMLDSASDTGAGRYLETLGRSPRRMPAGYRVVREIEHEHGRERYLLISGGADYSIPARMLLPRNASTPGPAVLAVHGHERQGRTGKSKLFEADPRNPSNGYGRELALRGFIVLAIDLAGFEDRRPKSVQPGPWRADPERLVAMNLLLRGATPMGLAAFDLSRAVDALMRMPEVDAARLGAIGHSMGASIVPSLLMMDRRLRAGVSACGLATWRSMMERHVIHNFGVYVPGLLALGDLDTLYQFLAPRNFAVIGGALDDNFPVQGLRDLSDALTAAYERQGASENLLVSIHGRGHAFDAAARKVAFDFLERLKQ